MSNNDRLTYLGILSAPTDQGPRAVAVALSGAVDLHHFVDAGLDTQTEVVRDWLWSVGINPDNAATAMPADALIRDVLLPAIGGRVLVIHHADAETPFVDALLREIRTHNGFASISGIDLLGPIESDANEEARRRSDALRARYEVALELAATDPLIHTISGEIGADGALKAISISGAFSKQNWTLETEDDALFVLSEISHMGPLAAFVIEPGPAQSRLKKLANEQGLNEKLAA